MCRSRPPRAANSNSASVGRRLFGPLRVRRDVLEGDVDDRVIAPLFEAAAGAFGMLPVRARRVAPPLQRIVERHRRRRGDEDGGAGHQFVARHTGIVFGIERTLGDGHVSRGLHEPLELGVGHRRAVHPEAVNRDEMHRERIRHPAVLAPHPERAAGHPHHPRRCRARGGGGLDVRGRRGPGVRGCLGESRVPGGVRVRPRRTRAADRHGDGERDRTQLKGAHCRSADHTAWSSRMGHGPDLRSHRRS